MVSVLFYVDPSIIRPSDADAPKLSMALFAMALRCLVDVVAFKTIGDLLKIVIYSYFGGYLSHISSQHLQFAPTFFSCFVAFWIHFLQFVRSKFLLKMCA